VVLLDLDAMVAKLHIIKRIRRGGNIRLQDLDLTVDNDTERDIHAKTFSAPGESGDDGLETGFNLDHNHDSYPALKPLDSKAK